MQPRTATGFSHGESLVIFKGSFRGEDAGLTQVVQEKMGEEEHGSNRRGTWGQTRMLRGWW